jgi:HAD superfamily hydrolase (TIGR01549 family)
MIETLSLDAGGVLVFPNWARVSEALARQGIVADASALAAAEPHIKRHIDLATTIATTDDDKRGWMYFDMILERLGIQPSDRTGAAVRDLYEYHQRCNLWESVPGDVPEALVALRQMGLRLFVVSNANGKLSTLFERVGLAQYFDCLIDSYDEGVEKPDPRLFEIALARAGARAATTLHVGDLYHVDVVGARTAGLQAVLLDAADLYPEADCPRIRTLGELVELLRSGAASP